MHPAETKEAIAFSRLLAAIARIFCPARRFAFGINTRSRMLRKLPLTIPKTTLQANNQ